MKIRIYAGIINLLFLAFHHQRITLGTDNPEDEK